MIDPSRLVVFVVAALALIVIPGPAVLYIVAQSINGGRVAGLVSALGVATGGLVHVCFAIAGLSAILVASATAFTVVKIAGAVYVLHCFQKKTQKTSKADLNLAAQRYRELLKELGQ